MSASEGMDWNDLRYFLCAVRARTLAGAARALGVEHSTIGRRLKGLEEALGVPLLTRSADGLKLTAIGERVVPLVEELERGVRAIQELVTDQRARVRVATPTGFGRVLSPQLVAFQAKHPNITIELLASSRMVDLKSGEADLAIRQGPSSDEDLIARKIADVAWSLYASDAYLARHPAPGDPRELAGHDLLGFETTLANVPGARWIEEHGQGANVIVRCRELTDIISACVAGIGLAVIPCMAAAPEPALKRLTKEVLGTRPLSIVYRKEVLVAEPVKTVIAFVEEVLRDYIRSVSGEASAP